MGSRWGGVGSRWGGVGNVRTCGLYHFWLKFCWASPPLACCAGLGLLGLLGIVAPQQSSRRRSIALCGAFALRLGSWISWGLLLRSSLRTGACSPCVVPLLASALLGASCCKIRAGSLRRKSGLECRRASVCSLGGRPRGLNTSVCCLFVDGFLAVYSVNFLLVYFFQRSKRPAVQQPPHCRSSAAPQVMEVSNCICNVHTYVMGWEVGWDIIVCCVCW